MTITTIISTTTTTTTTTSGPLPAYTDIALCEMGVDAFIRNVSAIYFLVAITVKT